LAVNLLEDEKTRYLLIDYKGSESNRFIHLCRHILDNDYGYDYRLYRGKKEDRVQVYIDVVMLEVEKAEEILSYISKKLQKLLPKEWRCLPTSSLPKEYNIATLPYALL